MKFICNYCGAEFKSLLDLLLHISEIHDKEAKDFIDHLDKCRKESKI